MRNLIYTSVRSIQLCPHPTEELAEHADCAAPLPLSPPSQQGHLPPCAPALLLPHGLIAQNNTKEDTLCAYFALNNEQEPEQVSFTGVLGQRPPTSASHRQGAQLRHFSSLLHFASF